MWGKKAVNKLYWLVIWFFEYKLPKGQTTHVSRAIIPYLKPLRPDVFVDSDFRKVMPTNNVQVGFAVKFLQTGNKVF